MTKKMLERVARAICENDPLLPEPDAPVNVTRADGVHVTVAWQARVPAARAAIAAMETNQKETNQ